MREVIVTLTYAEGDRKVTVTASAESAYDDAVAIREALFDAVAIAEKQADVLWHRGDYDA